MTLAHLLLRQARQRPDSPAIFSGAELHASHHDWAARSAGLAERLRAAGLQPGEPVLLFARNHPRYLEVLWGLWWAGLVAVPVNARLHPREVAWIIANCGARWAFVTRDVAPGPLQGIARQIDLESADAGTLLAPVPDPLAVPVAERALGDTAWLMYTSGTTGHPKGVLHSHLSVTTAVLGNCSAFGYTERDVLSGWLPLFHCAQHALAATACAAGASLVLSRGFVPAEIAQLVLHEGITVFVGLPMMYAAVLADPTFKPTTLRQCVYAMAPIPAPLIAQIAARMSDQVLLATGQTEIYPATMTFRPLEHPGRDANYWGSSLITCDTAVMDEDGRLLGPGEIGEIVHRGPNVMLGYFKDPEATAAAQRFGWHHTGDLGMWDEGGQMLFLDRKKDMIKTGGENVASVKVEAALLAHPALAGAAVLGLPHPHWGEAVCAVVVRKPGAECDEAQIIEHCRQRLAAFEVPKLVRFVEALPATATGKVQKHLLRQTLGSSQIEG